MAYRITEKRRQILEQLNQDDRNVGYYFLNDKTSPIEIPKFLVDIREDVEGVVLVEHVKHEASDAEALISMGYISCLPESTRSYIYKITEKGKDFLKEK